MMKKGRETNYKIRTMTVLENLPDDIFRVLDDLMNIVPSKKKQNIFFIMTIITFTIFS